MWEWVRLLLGSTIKGSIFIVAALGTYSLRKRFSSATRHFLLLGILVSLVLLPVFQQLLGLLEAPVLSPIPKSADINSLVPGLSQQQQIPGEKIELVDATRPMSDTSLLLSHWRELLFVLWLGGVVYLLLRCIVGWIGVMLLKRRSLLYLDIHTQIPYLNALRQINLKKIVPVLLAENIPTPMTLGFFKTSILLPAEAIAWPKQRIEAVLLHELSHVKRKDNLVLLLSQLICTLYWFNPLTWMIKHLLRIEAEEACDDQVIETGYNACDYASILLDVARRPHPGSIAYISSTMASKTKVEKRVRHILKHAKECCYSRTKAKLVSTVLLVALVLSVLVFLPERGYGIDTLNLSENAREFTLINDDGRIYASQVQESDLPLLWPLYTGIGEVVAGYGYQPGDPSSKALMNTGVIIDKGYSCIPVLSTARGFVREVSSTEELGNYVLIEHKNGLFTLYSHVVELFVKPGDYVEGGNMVAFSFDSYFHYEIRMGSTPIDPSHFLERSKKIG